MTVVKMKTKGKIIYDCRNCSPSFKQSSKHRKHKEKSSTVGMCQGPGFDSQHCKKEKSSIISMLLTVINTSNTSIFYASIFTVFFVGEGMRGGQDRTGSHCVAQAVLDLTILLPPPPEC
jgi:hypothetical protein